MQFVKQYKTNTKMRIEHNTLFDSIRLYTAFCNQHMIDNNYFIGEHQELLKTFVNHYAEGMHSKTNHTPEFYALRALSKLMFEIDKVTRSDNFDSEFASSSFSGC